MITIDKLHDATLESAELVWKQGVARLHIKAFLEGKIEEFELSFEGVTFLGMPRYEPWGPSISINKVWEENSGEARKLLIEMQSGDVLEIRCRRYSFNK
jgi:hypothetical protein